MRLNTAKLRFKTEEALEKEDKTNQRPHGMGMAEHVR